MRPDSLLLLLWLWCCCAVVAASFTAASFCSRRALVDEQPWLTASARMSEETERGGRRARKKQEFAARRDAWLARYGSVSALQSTFGTGPPLGDLSPEQTRSLYHTLLPRSLLGLHEMGLMRPEELAPLAYEGRIAAKDYARSRCIVTGRLVTAAFDQYRSLRDRGRPAVGSGSMSWDEIWQKYEGQIVQEECAAALDGTRRHAKRGEQGGEDLSMRIYLRILERSCATNLAFDSLFLKETAASGRLTAMALQLDEDVQTILLRPKDGAKARRKIEKAQERLQVEKEHVEKEQQAAERRETKLQGERAKAEMRRQKADRKEEEERRAREEKEEEKRQKAVRKEEKLEEYATRCKAQAGAGSTVEDQKTLELPTVSQRREVLRVLARTRRQFRLRSSQPGLP